MDAVILLNKPAGMTSFQAVAGVRKILHEKKIGHTGTLDPDATGLLIILTGKYTKYIPYCVCDHKHYEAQFQLGLITDTQDISGTVLKTETPLQYSDEQLKQYAEPFNGEILQIPPMYSALKKDGKKLYELARKGIEVEREPRKAVIEDLEVHHLHDDIYSLSATVSSGTYIRTLIQDYAASFGELACMTSLNRTAIEHVDVSMAADLEGVAKGEGFVSPLTVLNADWPLVETDRAADVKNGKRIFMKRKEDRMILVHDGEILAAYEREEGNRYRCVRGLF
ncbi:MAG: tRNA pseudouridine(55) synthase TruB [Bulleidia sp.]